MNKYLIAGIGGVAFIAGYYIAAQGYSEDIAQMEKAYAESARIAQEKHDAEIYKLSAELSETIAERDKKIADLERTERARADLSARMLQLAADSNRVPASDADPCKPVRTELQSCVRLLAEGSQLRQEGAQLLSKCASNLDAIKQLKH